MKEKIFIFIIGILVGAVLSTSVFYIYTRINKSNSVPQMNQKMGGNPPEMNGGEPPEMPNGEERPEKPGSERDENKDSSSSEKSDGESDTKRENGDKKTHSKSTSESLNNSN